MTSESKLEKVLTEGGFAITAELGPPQGNDPAVIQNKAALLKGSVDAVNITDNQTSVVRMSSIAAGALALQAGVEPVIQMTCRDRNRIAIQSDILGATSLGIKNVLCLSGDHQCFGNQKLSKKVFDIDSMQLIGILKGMRDEGRLLDSGLELEGEIDLFIGAAANPFARPFEFRPLRLKKKVEAGADFVQTQCIFDIAIFREWMKAARDMGLHKRCHILAGITPLKSAGMAKHMAGKVPGVIVPDEVVKRMSGVSKENAREEGIKICCEQIEQIRKINGIHGIHIMAIEWEEAVPEIVKKTGLRN